MVILLKDCMCCLQRFFFSITIIILSLFPLILIQILLFKIWILIITLLFDILDLDVSHKVIQLLSNDIPFHILHNFSTFNCQNCPLVRFKRLSYTPFNSVLKECIFTICFLNNKVILFSSPILKITLSSPYRCKVDYQLLKAFG